MQRAAAAVKTNPRPPPRPSLGRPDHGSNIYAYCNVRTRQVLYSLTRSLDSSQSLKQLPQLGPNTVPPKLRKDVWKPLYTVSIPTPDYPNAQTPVPKHANAQGLDAFAKLREYRRLHELYWEPTNELSRKYSEDEIEELEEKYEKRGGSKKESVYDIIKREKKKLRRGIVMDQKANSVADLAAVLTAQEAAGEERLTWQLEEMRDDRREEVEKIANFSRQASHGGLERTDREIDRLTDAMGQMEQDEQQGKVVEGSKARMKRAIYGLKEEKRAMLRAVELVKLAHEQLAVSHAYIGQLQEGITKLELRPDRTDVALEVEDVLTALERKWDLAEEKRGRASQLDQEAKEQLAEGGVQDHEEVSRLREEAIRLQEEAIRLREEAELMDSDVETTTRKESIYPDNAVKDTKNQRKVLVTTADSLSRARQIYHGLEALISETRKQMADSEKELKAFKEAWRQRPSQIHQQLDQLKTSVRQAKARMATARVAENNSDEITDEAKNEQRMTDEANVAQWDALVAELQEGPRELQRLLIEHGGKETSLTRQISEVEVKLDAVKHILTTRGVGPKPRPVLPMHSQPIELGEVDAEGEGESSTTTTTAMATAEPQASDPTSSPSEETATGEVSLKPAPPAHRNLPTFHELLGSLTDPPADPSKLPTHDKLRHKLRRLAAPVFSMRGVKVQWANILDAEFAQEWPGDVEHEHMGLVRHTAKHPDYKPKMSVLDTAPHVEEFAISRGEIEAKEVDELCEEIDIEDAEAVAELRRRKRKQRKEKGQAKRKAVVDALARKMVEKLEEPDLEQLKTEHVRKEMGGSSRAKRMATLVKGRMGATREARTGALR